MELRFVETGHGPTRPGNWGKFAVGRHSPAEWAEPPQYHGTEQHQGLLSAVGWSSEHVWVLDLQTGEGAMFRLGGYPAADLEKHRIWVCPMFQPFLEWLYGRYNADPAGWFDGLPRTVDLPDAAFAFQGRRRAGPAGAGDDHRLLMRMYAELAYHRDNPYGSLSYKSRCRAHGEGAECCVDRIGELDGSVWVDPPTNRDTGGSTD